MTRRVLALAVASSLAACGDDGPAAQGSQGPPPEEVPDVAGDGDDPAEAPDRDFGEVPDHSDRLRPPELRTVTPAWARTRGGDQVVIRGVGFLHVDRLTFDGVPSTDWFVRGVEEIIAEVPPGDAGPAVVGVDGPGGAAALAGVFTYVAEVVIDEVAPAQAPVTGGTPFTLRGEGLSRDVTVLVGARTAIDVRIDSDGALAAFFPPNDPGMHDVWVFSGDGASRVVARQAVRYRSPPQVLALRPASGPTAGGTPVEMEGLGFEPGEPVILGGRRVQGTVSADGRRLRFVTPPGRGPGPADVAVHSPIGDGGQRAAFIYEGEGPAAAALHALRPPQGPASGGATVDLVVSHLAANASVTFDGTPAQCGPPDGGVIRCTTPAHPPGPVQVTAKDDQHVASATDPYTYLPHVELTSVTPTYGGVAGGTIATLVGEGFQPGARVWFGAMESPSVRWFSAGVLTAVTPPGPAGEADIVVVQPDAGARATLSRGYEYQDRFRILAIDPPRGAQAGGTYVSILGTGFTPGLQPTVGGRDALNVRFRGSTRITFKTPPGALGAADVEIPGVADLPDAFTYFDPGTRYGGVWGDEIAGAVNVTLISGAEGDPIVGGFAMLGTDPATELQGRTDHRGQVTLSGPHLRGPISVTAGKEGFESQSFLLVEGENVTMYLTPLVPPSSGGGPREPSPPVNGTLHGMVAGIDKYVPEPRHGDEERVAYVETTQLSPYRPNPDPGQNVLTEDGPFTITTRPGDLAVVVVAGLLDRSTDTFEPYRMGVARWLFMPVLGVIDDVYVELTVPLTRRIGVTLIDGPFNRDEGPSELVFTPWFEFKPEGWFGGYNTVESEVVRDFWLEGMPLFRGPDFQGVHLHAVTSMFTDGSRPMVIRWDRDLDWASQFLDVGPFVGIPTLDDPGPEGLLTRNHFAWSIDGGVTPTVWSMRMMTQEYRPVWRIVAPGHVRSMVLPDAAALAPIPAGRHLLMFTGGLTDGWSPRAFEYGDLSVRGWDSWATQWARFRADPGAP